MRIGDAATLELALGVLGAIIERREPAPHDVLILRQALDGSAQDLAADELACEVINRLRYRVRPGTNEVKYWV